MSDLSSPSLLPTSLTSALARLRAGCAQACEQSVEGLGLSALSCSTASERDALLQAQTSLQRNLQQLVLVFAEALDSRVQLEWSPRGAAAIDLPTHWDELSLLDDRELENQVAAERFGQAIGHGSEWELRELEGFLRALAQIRHEHEQAPRRNVLRAENVGHAMIRAIDSAASCSAEARKLLEVELAGSWATSLPRIYAAIIHDMRAAGITPAAMAVRPAGRHAAQPASASTTQRVAAHDGPGAVRSAMQEFRDRPNLHSTRGSLPMGAETPPGIAGAAVEALASAPQSGSDPGLMSLLRRLGGPLQGGSPRLGSDTTEPADRELPTNLIRTHREELQHATHGSMDHMVIDVVGSLFDQILSDPKVPPQIAREIGRLQLPVLRTAIGDPSFFASRRHPVRRLVNRIASLAVALDDLDGEEGRALLVQVRRLVQDIVDGDFEQLRLYEAQLERLECFVADRGRREVEQSGARPELLAEREKDLQMLRRSARRLKAELHPLQAPDFVRDFLSEVWTRVLVRCTHTDGPESEAANLARKTACDLFMSLQPKGTPELRQEFLKQLPQLMLRLNRGMDLIGWPEEQRRAFFGHLLPAHARSLKGEGLRLPDFNLLAQQVEQALQSALPSPGDREAAATAPAPLENDHDQLLSPQEAQVVGLIQEDQVDWTELLTSEPAEEPSVGPGDLAIHGLPEPDAPEPTTGRLLADHLQIGVAYQMHLSERWQKVRLTHVSPGRTFYVFSRGKRHQRVLSMTRRMLLRLCETGRLRAYERAYLLERATARARRQLAALQATPATHD
jgi:Protein of unknown function (DUF1631)